MKIVITGAAGRVGEPMTRRLLEAGYDIRAVDRQYSGVLGVRVELADLSEPLVAYRVLEGADALVHLASPSASRITLDTFGPAMTMNVALFQAAADMGLQKIIYASSIRAICGKRTADQATTEPSDLAYLPIDGDSPVNAGDLYGLTKVFGEQQLAHFCQHHDICGVALRFPHMAVDSSMSRFIGKRGVAELGHR